MKKYFKFLIFFFMSFPLLLSSCESGVKEVDVLVIGGGASGVSGGVQAARLGSKTLIVEEHPWLGGMLTSAGVSAIDGNKCLPSGFWGEFRDSLVSHYGSLEALNTGWVSATLFEPSVGNKIMHDITANEPNLEVMKESLLEDVHRENGIWYAKIKSKTGMVDVRAKVLIDATELGDVAKMCGVKYDLGMESRYTTDEKMAPMKANHIIQDLTYVAVLKDYGKDVTIDRPEGYDSTEFACAAINDLCITPKEPERMWSIERLQNYGHLPNDKYMINWPIEGNDYYLDIVEMSREERVEALKAAKHYTMCFLYFMQKDLGLNTLGLADDEFPTEDKLPFIPYHRESRRIHGEARFTLNHITDPYTQEENLYRTAIAVGDYPVDHHHQRYTGDEKLPDLYFYPVPSYGLPLGTIIPKEKDGLIVAEKSISVSNLINGTTRLQPVVLQIGQAAGTLAALAVKQDKEVRDVEVRDVQSALLESGTYLLPYLDVTKESPLFLPFQRIGVTGILQGIGRNMAWSNETWFRMNENLHIRDLDGLVEFYGMKLPKVGVELTFEDVELLIKQLSEITSKDQTKIDIDSLNAILAKYKIGKLENNQPISRAQFAVLIDQIFDPFNSRQINLKGQFK